MLRIVLSLLLITSCTNKSPSKEDCEILSMETYKGIPRSSHKYKSHCLKYKITYTSNTCQSALERLIITSDLELVKKEFGEKIKNCFTGNDLRKFSK